MLRRLLTAASIAFVAVPLMAQAPTGWKIRVDRSQNSTDPNNTPKVQFMAMGKGFHVISGPAGTFWNPAKTVTSDYTLSATFNLLEPSGHVNYYGLVFGGDALDGPNQNYVYFLVGQDGTYLVKHRAAEATYNVKAKTAHEAVKKTGADGQSVNALEVRVVGDTISYVVNGTVVHTTPRTGMTTKTDGIVGVRVNHLLNVHIDGFGVTKS